MMQLYHIIPFENRISASNRLVLLVLQAEDRPAKRLRIEEGGAWAGDVQKSAGSLSVGQNMLSIDSWLTIELDGESQSDLPHPQIVHERFSTTLI